MASNSDLFAKIRIKPRGSKKKEEETRAANECAWEGCEKPGAHKAPMGRNREGHYLNFCVEHVREYNKNFNYANQHHLNNSKPLIPPNLSWQFKLPRYANKPADIISEHFSTRKSVIAILARFIRPP